MATFYLTYRPQKIEDLDLTSVRESLTKIVDSGVMPHAFLFSGPKGLGKTSAARILAKVVNCEKTVKKLGNPCNKCSQCKSITSGTNIDVVELDAASHRGIDDVRALRDAVKLTPAFARKKVYIIDEAHMLTTEASNALLKTLEEPPAHVLFILATTNPEKLIDTIVSRTTNIRFEKATQEELVRSLKRVVQGEKIKVNKAILELIAQNSGGSLRDAHKLLEQILTEKVRLVVGSVEKFLIGAVSDSDKLLELIIDHDVKGALKEVEKAVANGVKIQEITKALLSKLRLALLAKATGEEDFLKDISSSKLIYLLTLLNKTTKELPYSLIEQLPLEIAIISWSEGTESSKLKAQWNNDNLSSGNITHPAEKERKKVDEHPVKTPDVLLGKSSELSDEIWRKILGEVKPRNTSIEALLRAAKPIGFDGRNLKLGVFYSFHKERLEVNQNRIILEEVCASVMGTPVRIVCTLTEQPQKRIEEELKDNVVLTEAVDSVPPLDKPLTKADSKDIINVAKEIFGS